MKKQQPDFLPPHEDEYNEFKESPAHLEKEIVAFANHKGGRIFIGVDDQGRIKPFPLSNRSRSQLIQSIQNCDPLPIFQIQEQKGIIILSIQEGSNKPYKAPGGFYLRMGASSQKLTRDQIINFFISENKVRFDNQIIASVENLEKSKYIDTEEIEYFKAKAPYLKKLSDKNLLLNLHLALENNSLLDITNAAILLFKKDAQTFFPQSRVLVWLMGSDTEILDQRVFAGTLLNQLEESFDYVKRNLKQRAVIQGLHREEEPEFPDVVLRELLINQLVHRDYFEQSADIEVKIYPERLEFSNPALLPKDREPNEMVGVSYRRNPLLAEAFQRIGLVERAGTGLLRVRETLQKNGLSPFLLSRKTVYFVVSLLRPTATQGMAFSSQTLDEKILQLLQNNSFTTKHIGYALEISERTVRNRLKQLLEIGAVQRLRQGRTLLYTKRR